MTKNYKLLFLSCVAFLNSSLAMSSETIYDSEGYAASVKKKPSKKSSRFNTSAEIQKDLRDHQDEIEEWLANYKTTQKEQESVHRHIEEITDFSKRLKSFLDEDFFLAPPGLATDFNSLVSSMTVMRTHPSGYLPKAVGLCPVSGFFMGTLNEKQTCGLISGSVKDPLVTEKEKRIIFSVTVGLQNFNGEISADPASRDTLKLISSASRDNVISFHLDPDFFANFSGEKVPRAWKNLFGVSRNNEVSARFFSASSEVPDGLKIEQKKCHACKITYKANSTLLSLAFITPNYELGIFYMGDGMSKQSYVKTITSGVSEDARKKNKNLEFFTPHSMVKIDVLPSFDFSKTWLVPVVVENNLILINSWRTSYRFSLLANNTKVDHVLHSSDFWEDLLKLEDDFSGEHWTSGNKFDRMEKVEEYSKQIKANLSLLKQYEAVLERALKKEELKFEREGIVLPQND